MIPSRRTRFAVISAIVLAAALTGCGSLGAPGADPSCPDAATALSALDVVPAARTATGPSTACLASNGVVAVRAAGTTSSALSAVA
ncbi:MAG: hypothetical protein IE935_15380, partial [Micrococcales bacterium]|nr:hypothetical protein [Micrococcales bacterium]